MVFRGREGGKRRGGTGGIVGVSERREGGGKAWCSMGALQALLPTRYLVCGAELKRGRREKEMFGPRTDTVSKKTFNTLGR